MILDEEYRKTKVTNRLLARNIRVVAMRYLQRNGKIGKKAWRC